MYKPILSILYSSARLVFGLTFLLSLGVSAGWAQIRVLTQHNDNSRTGANLNETILNTSNVKPSTFGKLFTMPVDGFVYAQPLYMTIGTQNVLFVATAHDSVYAFDADTGAQLWQRSLGTPVPSSVINTPNIQVEVGIISTPAIDPNTNTLYVVAKTYENLAQNFQLHALDISTGKDKLAPVQIAAQYPGSATPNDGAGHVLFVASEENQRAALTLVNHSVLYVAFASHEDHTPYHGWVLAYDATSLQQIGAFNTTPNGGNLGGGGIWMSGQGFVVDSNNNVYCITGNTFPSYENAAGDYGECFLKLGGNPLSVLDYFKAFNYDYLNNHDIDLGSGGPVAIPGPGGKTYLVGGGKEGFLYVVDTTNMGGLSTTGMDHVVQKFRADSGLWGSPVFWNMNPAGPTLYVWGRSYITSTQNSPGYLTAYSYSLTTGKFTTTPASVSSITTPGGDSAGALSVTSWQSNPGTGILWATIPLADPDHQTVAGRLLAFDATNVATKLYDSASNSARDNYGNFAKFVPPTVVNGKVYVATDSKQVCAYGLISSTTTPSPDGTVLPPGNPPGQIVDSALNIWTIQDAFETSHSQPNGFISPCAFENGSIAGYNYNVLELAFKGGIIWVENTSGKWYWWNGSSWVAGTKPPGL
jgi:PQQ enzyme repeat